MGRKGGATIHKRVRRLSRSYWLLIVSIPLLAILGQWLIRVSVASEERDSKLIHLAANYQVTGLKVLKDVYALGEQKSNHTVRRLDALRDDLQAWTGYHNALFLKKGHHISPEELNGNVIEPAFQKISHGARVILSGGEKGLHSKQLKEAIASIQQHDQLGELGMDGLVYALTLRRDTRAFNAPQLQLLIVLLTLAVFLVEMRYVFRPAMTSVQDNFEELESASRAVAEERHLVEAQKEQLQSDNDTLHELASNLEAANNRIETAAKRFEELFQGLPIACVGYDASGAIFEWNRSCETLFSLTPDMMFQTSVYDILDPEDHGSLVEAIAKVFQGESVSNIQITKKEAGGDRYLLCSTFPIHGQENQISGAILSCVDVTAQKKYELQIEEQLLRINEYSSEVEQRKWELEEANARLESLASTDGLTGLHNHRSFQEALSREMKRSERDGSSVSLVLLDVDDFKHYNDGFGHPAGDAVLKQLASVLLQSARESDFVGRYGGEEFVVILPNTNVEGARRLAERVRAAVESDRWEHRSVTVSLGVSTSRERSTPASLIKSADRALYASKDGGRNRTTHCDELEDISEAA